MPEETLSMTTRPHLDGVEVMFHFKHSRIASIALQYDVVPVVKASFAPNRDPRIFGAVHLSENMCTEPNTDKPKPCLLNV